MKVPEWFHRAYRWLLLTAGLSACQGDNRDLSDWRDLPEPGADLVSAPDTMYVLGRGSVVPGSLQYAFDFLTHLEVVDSVGTLESDIPGEMFGRIEAAEAKRSDRIAVLDSRYDELRLYTAYPEPLKLIAAVGRPGMGPGEFRDPDAIALTATTAFVADGYNLTRFEIEHAGFGFLATKLMRVAAEDMCILDDFLYIHGLRWTDGAQETIHRFTLDGEHVSSFAALYESSNPWAVMYMTEGQIACAATARLLVHVARHRPYISGFTSAGDLVWLSRIERYSEFRTREGPGRAIRQTVPEDGGHWLVSLLNGPHGSVIVQLGLATMNGMREGRRFDRLQTYVVSAGTGQGVFVTDSLPRLLAVAGASAFAARDEPVPQMLLYRFVGDGEETNK